MMMSNNQEPMIKLQPGGTAPILSYNVPEPTAYSGRNFIDLQFPDSYFTPSTVNGLAADDSTASAKASLSAGPTDSSSEHPLNMLASLPAGTRVSPSLANLDVEEVKRMESEGKKLNLYKSMTGALTYNYVDAEVGKEPTFATGSQPANLNRLTSLRAIDTTTDEGPIPTMLPIDDGGGGGDPYPDPIIVYVDITSPAANTTISGTHTGAVFNVHGTSSEDSGGTITKVQVQIDSGTYQTAQLDGAGNWVLPNATITTAGAHTISAKAYSGTKYTIRKININVTIAEAPDTTLPLLAITSPAAGQFYSTNGAANASVTIEGTASDNRSVSKVEISLDNGAFVIAESSNGWANWKKTLPVGPGNHSLTAKCTDGSGNVTTRSLSVSVDAAPPSITIASPLNNAQIAGTNSKGAIIEVTGTAQDAGGIKAVEVSLDLNPVFVPAAAKAPGDWSTWKATFSVTEPGIHILTARVTDLANNTVEKSVSVNVTILPEVSSRLKRIILVESYRMSSFLGNYGAGGTIKTTSLLPGEKTKISIRSYTQNEETSKNASTILDSVTDEIADEFEKSMGNEQTDQKNYKESFEYKVSAEAGASWGWGSASVSASASGGTNAARDQFARNISNSTQKHVARASARRDVQINTNYEAKTTTNEENSIVRDIENINVSRTLNFVFRQMNQEFITLLHLVDLRIGFFKVDLVNGQEKHTYKEVTLPQLDALLTEIVVADKRKEVRNAIINQMMNIFDYQDRHHRFVEEEPFKDEEGNVIPLSNYLRVKKDYVSSYYDKATDTNITVPGIILAANRHVLRTEGVIVEALLGQGEALDDYSRNLQTETVREKNLRNGLLETEMRMKQLVLEILESRDEQAAKIYAMLNPQPAAAESGEEASSSSISGGASSLLAGTRA